jgi:two-component system, chemotaxis family, chemotaxis protein CheY
MIRILAVDDSKTIRSMLHSTLAGAGFDVTLAEHGEEALQMASQQQFALVVTDVNMPKMDGITLVRALRQKPEYAYIPILVCTTESSQEQKKRGREAGATGWIVKPFQPARLVDTVRKVLA